jgi:CRP-like cAMP-binding protein
MSIDERTPQQVDSLNSFVHTLKFFQIQTPDTQVKLCRTLTYERYPAGHIIFQQGDAGDKFYIILSGSASVHIRKDETKKPPDTPVTPKAEAPKMSSTSGTHRPINLAHSSRGHSIQLGQDAEGVRTVMMQLMTHGKPDLLDHKEKRASRRASRKLLRPSKESKEMELQRKEKERAEKERVAREAEARRHASNDIDIPIPLDDIKDEEHHHHSKPGSSHGKEATHTHTGGHGIHGAHGHPPHSSHGHAHAHGAPHAGAGEAEVGGAKHLKEVHEIKKKLEAASAMAKKPKEFKHISDVDDIEGAFGTCIRVCEAGQSFGESALITNAARGATIICREVTEAMTISKADYRHIFGIPGPEFRKEVPHIRTILQRHQRTPADVEYLNEVLSKMELFSIMPLIMRRFVFTRLGYVKLDQNVLLYEQGNNCSRKPHPPFCGLCSSLSHDIAFMCR